MTAPVVSQPPFGNPLIRGIAEIRLPDPAPWIPSAPGWMILWSVLALAALAAAFRLFLRWRRNAYRRRALKALRRLHHTDYMTEKNALTALPRILKNAALRGFPRTMVAGLYGESWLAFLESRFFHPGFRGKPGMDLLAISYHNPDDWDFDKARIEAVFSLVRMWIIGHRRENAS